MNPALLGLMCLLAAPFTLGLSWREPASSFPSVVLNFVAVLLICAGVFLLAMPQ